MTKSLLSRRVKKPSCPFGRHCFTDGTVCGHIGEYAECPLTLADVLRAEMKEGIYHGDNPFRLIGRPRRHD